MRNSARNCGNFGNSDLNSIHSVLKVQLFPNSVTFSEKLNLRECENCNVLDLHIIPQIIIHMFTNEPMVVDVINIRLLIELIYLISKPHALSVNWYTWYPNPTPVTHRANAIKAAETTDIQLANNLTFLGDNSQYLYLKSSPSIDSRSFLNNKSRIKCLVHTVRSVVMDTFLLEFEKINWKHFILAFLPTNWKGGHGYRCPPPPSRIKVIIKVP